MSAYGIASHSAQAKWYFGAHCTSNILLNPEACNRCPRSSSLRRLAFTLNHFNPSRIASAVVASIWNEFPHVCESEHGASPSKTFRITFNQFRINKLDIFPCASTAPRRSTRACLHFGFVYSAAQTNLYRQQITSRTRYSFFSLLISPWFVCSAVIFISFELMSRRRQLRCRHGCLCLAWISNV